jgi:hypothetical protein
MRTTRRALSVLLSGMAVISAPLGARAEPPSPDGAVSAAQAAPAVPAVNNAAPAPAAPSAPPPAPSTRPGATPAGARPFPAATPLTATPYPYSSPFARYDLTLPPPDLIEPPPERWYGWQTLTTFGGSAALTLVAAAVNSMKVDEAPEWILVGAFGGYALGGPIVHWAHGNVGKGFASLGINAAGILSGLVAGVYAVGGHSGDIFLGTSLGGSLGALVATILDTTLLTYGPRKPAREDASARQRREVTLLPTLDIRKDRASLGFVGAF